MASGRADEELDDTARIALDLRAWCGGDIVILGGQCAGSTIEDGDLGTEVSKHRGEFEAGITAAEDHEFLRQRGDMLPGLGVVDAAAALGSVSQMRPLRSASSIGGMFATDPVLSTPVSAAMDFAVLLGHRVGFSGERPRPPLHGV